MADKKKSPKKESPKISSQYEDGKSKNKNCPKCGSGFKLAEHKDRRSCGKCSYMERK